MIAAEIIFNSTIALWLADLEGLPSNSIMGPVNAKPLQGVRKTHSEQTIDRMCQTTLEIIYRSDPGTVCDVRIRKLQKRTSSAAERKITESATGRNPEIDCNNA